MLSIQQVENGYIVKVAFDRYVFSTLPEMYEWLTEYFTKLRDAEQAGAAQKGEER